jgi:GAF domain-containing protein
MSTSATRFLQQENIRLTKEIEALKHQNLTLVSYFEIAIALCQTSQQLSPLDPPLAILDELVNKVKDTIGAEDCSIMRLDEEAGELEYILVQGELSQQLKGYRMSSSQGIAGWVVENKEPIIVNYPRQDWRFSAQVDEEFGFLTRSIASAPIMSRNKLYGVIHMLNKHGEFNRADIALMLILSQATAKVLENIHR